jgi:ABC-2 type transport system ATP-binding protein
MSIEVKIEHIKKRYSKDLGYVLNNISFDIVPGEIFGILGPNGAGKTTLISIMCNIINSTSGLVSYKQNDRILGKKEIKQILGYTPQNLAFYQELTPRQNMNFFGAMHGLTKKETTIRTNQLFKILGLTQVDGRIVKTFSGGMKRRLNLAISILQNPSILFLDEPTVGVDVQSKNAIISFLREINEKGTTIVYTSHYLEEAELLCDRILLIDQGQKVAYGNINNLKQINNVKTLEELFLKTTGTEYRDEL